MADNYYHTKIRNLSKIANFLQSVTYRRQDKVELRVASLPIRHLLLVLAINPGETSLIGRSGLKFSGGNTDHKIIFNFVRNFKQSLNKYLKG